MASSGSVTMEMRAMGTWMRIKITRAVKNMTAVRRMSIIWTLRNRRTVSTSEVHRWTRSPVDTCL